MSQRRLRRSACAWGLAALALPAMAQDGQGLRVQERPSWIPHTTHGYLGINLGRSDFDVSCSGGFRCDRTDWGGKISLGGMATPNFGVEVGYVNVGEADRDGGSTEAQGINISAVGVLPLSTSFSLVGRLGTTYGWTDTSASSQSGADTGSAHGFGLSYGAGLLLDLSRDWAAVLEWDRYRFRFEGGRDDVDLYSIGLKYKF
jgi:OOP family OmpA-OmpF porin